MVTVIPEVKPDAPDELTEVANNQVGTPTELTESAEDKPDAPDNLAEVALNQVNVPTELTEVAEVAPIAPLNTTEVALNQVDVPTELTETGEVKPIAPLELTEVANNSVGVPTGLTEIASSSVDAPTELSDTAEIKPDAPDELAEVTNNSVGAPTGLSVVASNSVGIPTELSEVALNPILRTIESVLNLNFAQQSYAENDEGRALTDLVDYSRNSSATFWNRRINERGRFETFLDIDYVGNVENLATYSEDLLGADWTDSSGLDTTATNEKTPDGKPAFLLTSDGLTTFPTISQDVTESGTINLGFAVKDFDSGYCVIRIEGTGIGGGADTVSSWQFNFNGDFKYQSGFSEPELSATYEGDGWWYITIAASTTTLTKLTLYPKWNELVAGSIYATKCQLTQGIKKLPYVKTVDTQVTLAFTESPRIGVDPLTAQPKGFLAERNSENLFLNSEDFSTTWSLTECTLTENAAFAPDGTKSADLLTESVANASHHVQQTIAFTSGVTSTAYFFVKANGRTTCRIGAANTGTWAANVNFDLSTGAVTAENSGTGKIVALPDGWFMVSATGVAGASASTNVRLFLGTATYTGDGTSGIYVWGGQLEDSRYPTSYIRTEGVTVSRLYDQMSIENFDVLPDATIHMEIEPDNLPSAGSGEFRNLYYRDTVGAAEEFANIQTDGDISVKRGSTAVTIANDGDFSGLTEVSYSMDESAGTLTGYVNALTPVTSSNGGDLYDTTSTMWIGSQNGTNNGFDGHIGKFMYYGQILTDAEVARL